MYKTESSACSGNCKVPSAFATRTATTITLLWPWPEECFSYKVICRVFGIFTTATTTTSGGVGIVFEWKWGFQRVLGLGGCQLNRFGAFAGVGIT